MLGPLKRKGLARKEVNMFSLLGLEYLSITLLNTSREWCHGPCNIQRIIDPRKNKHITKLITKEDLHQTHTEGKRKEPPPSFPSNKSRDTLGSDPNVKP